MDIIENFPFCIGDKVAVSLDTELFETLQDGHGGWNPKMAEVGIMYMQCELLQV